MPNKVRIFPMKACQDGLPTFKNLKIKHVEVEDECLFYKNPRENLLCALVTCPTIRPWWLLYLPNIQFQHQTFIDLALYIQQSGNHDDLAHFFSIAWGLQC